MARLVNGILLLSMAVAPGFANTLLFQGTFNADNQVAQFSFTANSPETITFQTYSYGGGSVDSATILSGGFAPSAFVFDNLGDVIVLTQGACGQVAQDPATMNCDDLFYQNTFGPGMFTLALTVDDNRPVDTTLADGFTQDGSSGFTCLEAGTSGSFCDVTTALGTTRTGDYAISITGADSVTQLPEPGSLILLFAGGAFTALLRRRSSSLR